MVTELARRGHTVTYVTTAQIAEPIEAAGAGMLHYESKIADVNAAEVFAEDDAGARPHLPYIAENIAILQATEAHYGEGAPDLVVYGNFPIIAGRLLATKWRRPAARLSAAFVSNDQYSLSQEMIKVAEFTDPPTLDAIHKKQAELLAAYRVDASVKEFWNRVEDFNVVFIPKASKSPRKVIQMAQRDSDGATPWRAGARLGDAPR
jgi:dTDP-L-oleandrosyltransferase